MELIVVFAVIISEMLFVNLFKIMEVVRDKIFPVPILLIGNNFGELVNLEFLVFGGVGIIKSPLLVGMYLQIKLIS